MTGALPQSEVINAVPWQGPAPPARILAIRIQAMGDTVATFPYLSALRRAIPDAEIDFLTRADYVDLARSVTLFDRVVGLRGLGLPRQLLGVLRALPALWRRRYDVVLDLQRNRVSRIIRRALAPAGWSEFDRFSPIMGGERFRRTVEAAGLKCSRVYPDLVLQDPEAGRDKLVSAGWTGRSDLIILNPAGAFPGRQWPIERYVAFGQSFRTVYGRPVQFVLLGVPQLASRVAAMARALGDVLIDLVGRTTMPEALGIVSRARLMLSEDGGLMHVAWVLGVPTVGLFGASRWIWARPHGNYSVLVPACLAGDGVCMDGTCRQGLRSCLPAVSVERVMQAALRLLQHPPPAKVIFDGGSRSESLLQA